MATNLHRATNYTSCAELDAPVHQNIFEVNRTGGLPVASATAVDRYTVSTFCLMQIYDRGSSRLTCVRHFPAQAG